MMWFAVMVSSIESAVGRVLAKAGQKLFATIQERRKSQQVRESARTPTPTQVVNQMLAELDGAQIQRFEDYLSSPDFEEIVLQYVVAIMAGEAPSDDLQADIRHEIWLGLRNNVGLEAAHRLVATDALFNVLTEVTADRRIRFDKTKSASAMAMVATHLAASVAANSRLLEKVGNLAAVHNFAQQLRVQVIALHGHMRLPHLGVSRSVPYHQLYVDAVLRRLEQGENEAPDLMTLPSPGQHSVILGAPGAGKSTLAAKLAHDVASDLVPGAEGRVPFLLVLREFAGSFRDGGKAMPEYLERLCRAPYNLAPPPDAVEYLLGNGQAVVLLDGLDELVEPDLRRRFVQLVEGFVSRFPLVPIIVTARKIGYSDAPLDRRMFDTIEVSDLTDDQVTQYTERWFALDESTAKADRPRMTRSFLAESEGISDLRANPLLLSLLCAMYSSEHYIPTNLAQVYERCAVMLFDRWDVIRGISKTPQFQGQLRGAVQHLAWQLFTADESGKALPRHRIIRLLADHLVAKQFDEDEAIETAETFVQTCTGRAWVLTDVGATQTEPRYGFTHRTFLEFFAAEHLVRTHPTAQQLWTVLQPRVIAGEWEVVAQIALQLLERNVDGGVDKLLRLVLEEQTHSDDERATLNGFAARALGYVHPGHAVIRETTIAAMNASLAPKLIDRYHYWISVDHDKRLRVWDDALHTLMYDSSPSNIHVIQRAIKQILEQEIASNSESTLFTILNLGRHYTHADQRTAAFWINTQVEIQEQSASALAEWARRSPWSGVLSGNEPERVIAQFGVQPLYLADLFLTGSLPSVVQRLLSNSTPPSIGLCQSLIAAPRPWISDTRWWTQRSGTLSEWINQHKNLALSNAWWPVPLVLLFLPYLESLVHEAATSKNQAIHIDLLPSSPLVSALYSTRLHNLGTGDVDRELRKHQVPNDINMFFISWARNEFDLVSPPTVFHDQNQPR